MTPDDATLIANEVRYLTQRFDEHAERTEARFDHVDQRLDRIDSTLREHNGRLRTVEAGWERLKGALAAVGLTRPWLLAAFAAAAAVLADRTL